MTAQSAVENYINGNIITFRKWIKATKKLEMLDAFEIFKEQYGIEVHRIIQLFRNCLN